MKPVPSRVLLPLLFVLLLLPAIKGLTPRVDHDTWWHLRTAERIVAERAVPRTDTFARHALENRTPWQAYSWLWELLLLGAYALGGHTGILLFGWGTIAAAMFAWAVLLERSRLDASLLLVAVVLLTVLLQPLLTVRPWHITILGTVLTLLALDGIRRDGCVRRRWWLIPTFCLWANMHIQFTFGIGMTALAVAGAWLQPSRWACSARALSVLAGACGAATLLTPYHVRQYAVIVEYATQTVPLRVIVELTPPDWADESTWATFALLGAALATRLYRRDADLFPLLLLVVGTAFSLRMRRDIWFGGVVAIYALGRQDAAVSLPVGTLPRLVVAAFALVLLVWGVAIAPRVDWEERIRREYPLDAVRHIRAQSYPGPIYNNFSWGGYLIYELRNYPVAIDGRTNLQGEARILRNHRLWSSGVGSDPDFDVARLVIAESASPLTHRLRADARWAAVYEDPCAVVFVQRDSLTR